METNTDHEARAAVEVLTAKHDSHVKAFDRHMKDCDHRAVVAEAAHTKNEEDHGTMIGLIHRVQVWGLVRWLLVMGSVIGSLWTLLLAIQKAANGGWL